MPRFPRLASRPGSTWADALRSPVRRAEGRQPKVPAPCRAQAPHSAEGPEPQGRGSSNRDKARIKVAGLYARVADTRRDWLHKESTRIIRDSQAVYVEDLCVAGLGRTRLAKPGCPRPWSGTAPPPTGGWRRLVLRAAQPDRPRRSVSCRPPERRLGNRQVSDRRPLAAARSARVAREETWCGPSPVDRHRGWGMRSAEYRSWRPAG